LRMNTGCVFSSRRRHTRFSRDWSSDVCSSDLFSAETLGKKGMMEPIDYNIVDKSKMREGFGWEYGASTYFFSYIIAYDASKFGRSEERRVGVELHVWSAATQYNTATDQRHDPV